jgi:hypothetical protein
MPPVNPRLVVFAISRTPGNAATASRMRPLEALALSMTRTSHSLQVCDEIDRNASSSNPGRL